MNLHSLEVALRAFLAHPGSSQNKNSWRGEIHKLQVGDVVPEDAFTNYDTLGKLTEKFNAIVKAQHPEFCIDKYVVKLRDALAHGRVVSLNPNPPTFLIKFSKPREGTVTVTHIESIDDDWLKNKIKYTYDLIIKVASAGKILHPSEWPEA